VIQEFQPEHRTNFFIPFTITLQRVVQITKQVPKEAVDKTAEDIKTEEEKNKQQNTESKSYTVKAGDTLSKIAKNQYGNANDWDKIYQANKDKIASPHKIQIGQELILP
jgi:nucleoid-associated protein YgaU